jgi:hypothetical protein
MKNGIAICGVPLNNNHVDETMQNVNTKNKILDHSKGSSFGDNIII